MNIIPKDESGTEPMGISGGLPDPHPLGGGGEK